MEFIVSIMQNVALLSFAGLGIYITCRNSFRMNELQTNALLGLALGMTVFLVTITPVEFPSGATGAVSHRKEFRFELV